MILFLLLLCLVLSACSGPTQRQVETVDISYTDGQKIHLADFVKSSEIISLEAADNMLISRIDAVYFSNDTVIVVDNKQKSIFLFGQDGKALGKIHKRGRGPNEYIEMTKVMFDDSRREIIVYDSPNEKLLHYGLDGECRHASFIGDNNQRYIHDIINLPNGNFLCYQFVHGSIIAYDFDGVWEMSPDGKIIQWIWKCDMIHPSVSPAYCMSFAPTGIHITCLEGDCDLKYDYNRLDTVVMYAPAGKTAKDYKGMNNESFVQNWINGIKFHCRNWSTEADGLIWSEWSSDKLSKVYYTVYSPKKNNLLAVGNRFDWELNNKTFCFPSVARAEYSDRIAVIPSNIDNALVIPIYQEVAMSETYAPRLNEVCRDYDPTDANPLLQIWHLK